MKFNRWLPPLALALLLGACGPAEVILELRQDQDDDGFFDDQEVSANTDPLDQADHPYARGWPIDACRHSVSPSGNTPGQVTADFELMDQDDQPVSLHDFCGQAVLLVGAAFW